MSLNLDQIEARRDPEDIPTLVEEIWHLRRRIEQQHYRHTLELMTLHVTVSEIRDDFDALVAALQPAEQPRRCQA